MIRGEFDLLISCWETQHDLGLGTPQAMLTFLALGELTNWLNWGSLMYSHMHGLCSLNTSQHLLDGCCVDVIAATHGFSFVRLHVTAPSVTPASPNSTTTTTATVTDSSNEMLDTFFIEIERDSSYTEKEGLLTFKLIGWVLVLMVAALARGL